MGSEKDPKSEGCTKNRPLHYAVDKGHLEICRFLIKNNVDKNKNPEAGAESLSKQNTLPEKFESH